MFNNDPYPHSVWIDVFGVALFGVILLGGAGYLLYHAGGAASSLKISATRGDIPPVTTPMTRSHRTGPGLSARRSAPRPGPTPLFDGGVSAPRGSGVEAPFSKSWQERATPDLTGPSGSSAVPSGGGGLVGGTARRLLPPSGRGTAPEPSGPTIASRGPSDGIGDRSARTGRESAGADWRAEARRFSGRARALSGQLGQITRSSSEEEAESPREDAPATASASRTSSSASSGPGTPSDPSQVPIGGLEWLAAAGAAYALRRLGMQSGEG